MLDLPKEDNARISDGIDPTASFPVRVMFATPPRASQVTPNQGVVGSHGLTAEFQLVFILQSSPPSTKYKVLRT